MDEALLRSLTPSVLGILVRRGADFAAAERAVQDALVEAVRVWPNGQSPSSSGGGDPVPRRAAVAAYLHERDGDLATAARLYAEAAQKAPNLAERDHLTRQAARLNARGTH
jgi:predicted RNA polymerase sigma factor